MAVTLPRLQARAITDLHTLRRGRDRAFAEAFDIRTVLDVVTTYPRRLIDRTKEATISTIRPGESATVVVDVRGSHFVPARRGGKPRVEVQVGDGTGVMTLTFFNQPWRTKQLHEGVSGVLVFGKLDLFRGARQMVNPVVDLIGDQTGRLIPVYPQSEKERITSREVSELVQEALRRAEGFVDPLPAGPREDLGLVDRTTAFSLIHQPSTHEEWERAKRRLKFDELLRLQLLLVQRKRRVERESIGIRHDVSGELVGRFIERLPYELTRAQRRAIDEICSDLGGAHPMHRLLQGDVGSGKTVVAVAALLTGVQGGYQGALLAPTEVLAEQHEASVRELVADLSVSSDGNLFGDRPVSVALLTGRTGAAERRQLAAGLVSGEIDILIGTHALLTEGVMFRDLGVVVVDEQHRFGVEQRSILREKGTGGAVPDVLVMTATPIPRTAAMTVYGDLDVTVLDEMPAGRTPITTEWAQGPLVEAVVWDKVRAEVADGHQAYVVCPLVEESERTQAKSATATYEQLAAGELAGLRLGLLHGQMAGKDKEEVMARFRAAALDVLVATTVIEVGVDVPNATVMVIFDADRFGIAQLHQLRGRVGRGGGRSWCYLLGEATTEDGGARLKALEASTDGFELAEIDLDLRGEGTILGARQKGRNDLKLASLARDRDLVRVARDVAFELVGDGDGLSALPELRDEVRDLVDEEEAEFLFKN